MIRSPSQRHRRTQRIASGIEPVTGCLQAVATGSRRAERGWGCPAQAKTDQTAVKSSFGQPNLAALIVCHSPLVCGGLSAIIDWVADCTKSGCLGIIKADHCLSNKDSGHQRINRRVNLYANTHGIERAGKDQVARG